MHSSSRRPEVTGAEPALGGDAAYLLAEQEAFCRGRELVVPAR
jgi:hypothetical protein